MLVQQLSNAQRRENNCESQGDYANFAHLFITQVFSTALQLSAQRLENNWAANFAHMSHRCSHLRYHFQRTHRQMFSIKRTVCCFWINLFLIPKNLNNPFLEELIRQAFMLTWTLYCWMQRWVSIQGFVFSQHFLERWRKSLRFADASTLYATNTPLTTLDHWMSLHCDPYRCSRVQSKEMSSRWGWQS